MCNHIYPHFHTKFYSFQCGFWKGFNVHPYLLVIVKKWIKTLEEGGEIEAVLTGLCNGFDCIEHNWLITKFNAYGLAKQSISSVFSYLTKRKQRKKVDSAVSSRENLFPVVSQGSV